VTRRDRSDAGWLALLLLAFGLVVAPLLHSLRHAHGHSHGPATPTAPHGAGSLEHQALAFTAAPGVSAPTFFAVALSTPALVTPAVPALHARWTTAKPQGP
jgi:hypothetical protein